MTMTTEDLVELVAAYRDETGSTSVTALCIHVWNAALNRAATEMENAMHDGGEPEARACASLVRELRIES